jgi:hypothetical protein
MLTTYLILLIGGLLGIIAMCLGQLICSAIMKVSRRK